MAMDGRLGQLRLGVAALGLVGLGATGVALTQDAEPPGAAVPVAALPLEPLPTPSTAALDDGFDHYVVYAPAAQTVAAESESDGPTGVDAVLADLEDGHLPTLTLADLDALGDLLDHLDGDGAEELVAVLTDGRRLPVRTSLATSGTTTADVPAGIQGIIAADTTESVEDVGGGWFAVATAATPDEFADLLDSVDLDGIADVPILSASDDEHSGLLWGLDNPGGINFGGVIGIEDVDTDGVEARSIESGAGVIVAVIDSGSVPNHPDLPDFWVNVDEDCTNGVDDDNNGYVDDCNGWDFFNNDNTPFDPGVDNSHGTHVTGTIAAVPDNEIGVAGLAPGVTIMNIKALQNGSTWMSKTAAAVRYAVDNGASVINASWGSSGATRSQVPGLEDAIDYARDHGVIIVAAAGNASQDIGVSPTFPASFPHDNVLSVGAHTATGAAASFSNRGDVEVDLHAPGHYIVSTVPGGGYSAKQGTSMAAPHVTAAVALVQAADPGAGINEVRDAILQTVDHRPELHGLSATSGTLNAARALGLESGTVGDAFEVTVSGLDRLVGDKPAALGIRTTVRDVTVAGSRPIVVRATFLTSIEGVDYGFVDLPVTVNGRATVTDDHAQVILSSPAPAASLLAGITSSVQVTLPAGTHALIVELVDADDPDAAYGPAAVVFTEVPEAPASTCVASVDDDFDRPDWRGEDADNDAVDGNNGHGTREDGEDDDDDSNPGGGGDDDPYDGNRGIGDDGRGETPTDDESTTDDQPADATPPTEDDCTEVPAEPTPVTTVPPVGPTPRPSPGGSTPPTTTTTVPVPGPTPTPPPTTAPSAPAPGGEPPTPTTTAPIPTAPAPSPSEPAPSQPTAPSDPGDASPSLPGGSTPVTTVPLPAIPVPDEVPPVSRGGMTLFKISPTWGDVAGGNIAIISGDNLPSNPVVFVGPFPATVKRTSVDSIVIEMPPAFPGIFDVAVIDGFTLGMATLRNAYTYTDAKPLPDETFPDAPSLPPDYEPGDPAPNPWAPAPDGQTPGEDPDPSPYPSPEPDPSPYPFPEPNPTGPTTTMPAPPSGPGDTPTTEPSPPTTLPTPEGRPRLVLADDESDLAPLAHRVIVGSPIDLPPTDWSSHTCRRPACGADLHSVT